MKRHVLALHGNNKNTEVESVDFLDETHEIVG